MKIQFLQLHFLLYSRPNVFATSAADDPARGDLYIAQFWMYILGAVGNTFWTVMHSIQQRRHSMLARMMRLFSLVTLAIISASVLTPSYAQQHKAINLSNAKGLPFSDGVLAGNTLYIAGQEGADESGKLVSGGITPETKAALDNVEKVLKAAGFEWKDVVSVTVYLADIHDFAEMNRTYKSILPDPKPARATIQAAGLVNDARIEIAAIAVKQK